MPVQKEMRHKSLRHKFCDFGPKSRN